MGILKRNAGKLALIALIVFFSLPFIYSNEEEGDFSPFAMKSGLSYQANPISRLANRISSFYGLPQSNLTTTGERVNMNKGESIRNKVSGHRAFNKNYEANSETAPEIQGDELDANPQKGGHSNYSSGYEKYSGKAKKQNNFLQGSAKETNNTNINITNNVNTASANTAAPNATRVAAARARSNFEGGDPTIYESARGSALATSATSMSYDNYTYNKPNKAPAEEYVEIDGESYKVVKDITGKKYVATARGHVPYEEVLRNTISEREFFATKKRMVNASDSEVLQYITEQKQAANAKRAAAQKNNTGGYRTGAITSMGRQGRIDGSVSTDTGLDISSFNEVYEGIKNYKSAGGSISDSGGGTSSSSSSSSSSGGSRGGSSDNNYRGSSGGNNGIIAGVNLANLNRTVTDGVKLNSEKIPESSEVATVRENDGTTAGSMAKAVKMTGEQLVNQEGFANRPSNGITVTNTGDGVTDNDRFGQGSTGGIPPNSTNKETYGDSNPLYSIPEIKARPPNTIVIQNNEEYEIKKPIPVGYQVSKVVGDESERDKRRFRLTHLGAAVIEMKQNRAKARENKAEADRQPSTPRVPSNDEFAYVNESINKKTFGK